LDDRVYAGYNVGLMLTTMANERDLARIAVDDRMRFVRRANQCE
jgi:hypothetical protein